MIKSVRALVHGKARRGLGFSRSALAIECNQTARSALRHS